MFGSSRFSFLVVALVAFVSFVTARTVITSQTCATRYCDASPKHINKATITIRKTVPYTVTRWKTVSGPRSTRTVKVTKTVTSQKYFTVWQTTSTTSLVIIWIGTTTHTRTVHATSTSITKTITLSESTSTLTTPSVTVAAPSGFVAIVDDPINDGIEDEPVPPPWWELNGRRNRRSAAPEPVAAKKKYVTAITCTKTLLTKTGTSDLWRTTTKAATTTKTIVSTKTVQLPLLTTTKTTTNIILTTTRANKVIFASSIFTSTRISYSDTTTYLSTVTTNLPAPTYYESCGPKNRSPPPEFRRHWTVVEAEADQGETIKVTWGNGTSYDCCAACHTYNEGGTCIGSSWRALTWWGETGCQEPPIGSEPCPEFSSKCELIIATSDQPAQCRIHGYKLIETLKDMEAIVSNGLSCARWQFGGFITSW